MYPKERNGSDLLEVAQPAVSRSDLYDFQELGFGMNVALV